MEASGKNTKLASSKQEEEFKLRRRIADGSQDPDDYSKLGDLLIDAGRYEDAVALYQRALNLPLTNLQKARVSTELGWIFYEVGPQEEALKLAQSVIAFLSPEQESPEVLAYRGASQSLIAHCVWSSDAKSGEEAARLALSWLKRLMIEAPDFEEMAAAYYDAARLQNLLGNATEALVLCEKCLQYQLRERERLSCLSIYGEALRQEGRFEEAEQTLEKIVQDVSADRGALANLYFSLGLIRRSTNRLAEARETFEKALGTLRADPYLHDDLHFLIQIHWNLGELYYQSEDLEKALKAFQQILAYNPEDNIDHRNALLWVGYCYQAMRDSSKALDYFREVSASPHASDTEKASARKGLAWNLGKIHYGAEEYREAAPLFEQVLGYQLDDDPDRYSTLLWLGHCYFAIGDNAKARDCYEKVTVSPHAVDLDKEAAREALSNVPQHSGKTLH